jgi:Flp pilus assembly protein TadG
VIYLTKPASLSCRRRSGAALIEMAMVLTLLMLLTFGGVEFGDVYFKKNTLQGAAREGARAAIVAGADNTKVTTAVSNVLKAAGITTGFTIAITDTNDATVTVSSVTAGDPIKVKVSAKWKNIGVRPLGIMSGENTITGSAVMRKES